MLIHLGTAFNKYVKIKSFFILIINKMSVYFIVMISISRKQKVEK